MRRLYRVTNSERLRRLKTFICVITARKNKNQKSERGQTAAVQEKKRRRNKEENSFSMSVLIIIFFSKQSHSLKKNNTKTKHNRSGSKQKVTLLFGEINCSLHSPLSAGLVSSYCSSAVTEGGGGPPNEKQKGNASSKLSVTYSRILWFFFASFQGLKSFK